MSELQDLLIARFISRADAYAIQESNGKWHPARSARAEDPNSQLLPWTREALQAHIDGTITCGHYMLGHDSSVNLIAFDIDLATDGILPYSYDENGRPAAFIRTNVRDVWHDRASIHRAWLKVQLRSLSHKIASIVRRELEIPVAVAYSGNKGVHVYGFTGNLPAADARVAANLVMEAIGTFKITHGSFLWEDTLEDPYASFAMLTVEVFPKQDEVSNDGFGNLMALPLGVNRKHPEDPKFFIDMRAPMEVMSPVDPIWALSTPDPWKE